MSNVLAVMIAKELDLQPYQVAGVLELLDAGNTIPFIARYRKEVTGGLDEVQLRQIEARLAYLRNLLERKQTVLASVEEQGKLTPELRVRDRDRRHVAAGRRPLSALQAQAAHSGDDRARARAGAAG